MSDSELPPDLTRDAFLGGSINVLQPREGYRSGNDAVFLAAATSAKPGDSVLELGCGVGVASLCLMARVPDLQGTGVELQPEYARLAERNAEACEAQLTIVLADLADLPGNLMQQGFDWVMANPPYFLPRRGSPSMDGGRDVARRERTPIADWIDVAAARLKPRGWLVMIQVAERLPDVLASLSGFGSVSVLPLQSRASRPAGRVLVRARKGGRAPFRLLPPLVLHEGRDHIEDSGRYTKRAESILRHGEAIDWADRK